MLHPLSCRGFNADFDGDQMAVHLPLSIEAQVETHILMMTTSNIFSPANGSPMVGPSQDMVMGNYYLTHADPQEWSETEKSGKVMTFRDTHEAMMAYEMGKIGLQQKIKVRVPKKPPLAELKNKARKPAEQVQPQYEVIETTVGRCIFNDILPERMPFYNTTMAQKKLSQVISDCLEFAGSAATVDLLDRIKDLGFKYATLAGLSFGLMDLKIPPKKHQIIDETEKKVGKINKNYHDGALWSTSALRTAHVRVWPIPP
jgi:DNA-directed RNA polymerase subunit beta'